MTSPDLAILLTPPGSAAIAVIRLLGPAMPRFLRDHFSRPLSPGRPIHGNLTDASTILDDPIVVLSPDNRFADISLHGGLWVVRTVLDLAARSGFHVLDNLRAPLPPEALDADDPLQQEVLSYLPLARTDLALRSLLAQPAAWRNLLQTTPDPQRLQAILADRSLHWLLHPPRVAIIGAPNVGKSTLANQLFAQQRVITADIPGTTRDWVGELANLDGLAVMLVDTPGLRSTDDPIEQQAVAHASAEIQRADLVLLVLDPTQPLSAQSPHFTSHPGARVVVNKCDLPPLWDTSTISAIHASALTSQGIDPLRSAIRAHFACESLDPTTARCWTDRQRHTLQHALASP